MNRDNDRQTSIILAVLGILPIVWLGLLIAPSVKGGLPEILPSLMNVMSDPFHIVLCEDSVKTVLVLLLCYGMGIGIYFSTRRNYRRREEHGSAKWGNAKAVDKKYRQNPPSENKLMTQAVRIGLNGKKHRRNLNTLVCGGSGAGKTRFYCKPNLMQANTSFVILDPNGKEVLGYILASSPLNTAANKRRKGGQKVPKIRDFDRVTALYERLSKDDEQQGESNSILNQELLCRGWFLPPNTYDCGSFVVNGTAVVGKESKSLITAANQHKKELIYMKSIFEQTGGTYRQEGDYLIPNLALPDEPDYQIGKYGRMRRSYLKEHRPVLYASLLTSGTLHWHLAEIDQACNERMEIIVSDMARQEGVTEALKAADQMEWVRRILVTLLVASLCGLIRAYGGFESILAFIRRVFRGKRGGQLGIGLLVGLMDIATANNAVAIVMAGPIAKEVAEEYGISPKRSASLLDTFSCIFQGIIPLLFYPFLLCLSSLLFILFDKK